MTTTNGPPQTTASGTSPPSLDELRARHEAAKLAHEVAVLESETWQLKEDWTQADLLRRRVLRIDSPPPSLPGDRRAGREFPWATIDDLDRLRQDSRLLSRSNAFAVSIIQQIVETCIGCGGTFASDVEAVTDVMQEWSARHNWSAEAYGTRQAGRVTDSREVELLRR